MSDKVPLPNIWRIAIAVLCLLCWCLTLTVLRHARDVRDLTALAARQAEDLLHQEQRVLLLESIIMFELRAGEAKDAVDPRF